MPTQCYKSLQMIQMFLYEILFTKLSCCCSMHSRKKEPFKCRLSDICCFIVVQNSFGVYDCAKFGLTVGGNGTIQPISRGRSFFYRVLYVVKIINNKLNQQNKRRFLIARSAHFVLLRKQSSMGIKLINSGVALIKSNRKSPFMMFV